MVHLDRFVTAERAKADFLWSEVLTPKDMPIGWFLLEANRIGSYGLMPLSKGGYRTDSGKVFEV